MGRYPSGGGAAIDELLDGPSYKAAAGVNWEDDHSEQTTPWLPNARSLLVLAMHHPEDDPGLDWFYRGNTAGNRRLTEISEALVTWLLRTHGVNAQALAYQVERGGVHLKDAPVFAGLGVVGKNNLILHPRWKPRLRLRSVLIEARLSSSRPLENFDPCCRCAMPCRTRPAPKTPSVRGNTTGQPASSASIPIGAIRLIAAKEILKALRSL